MAKHRAPTKGRASSKLRIIILVVALMGSLTTPAVADEFDADLQVTVAATAPGAHGPAFFVAGEQLKYTITVDNLAEPGGDHGAYSVSLPVPAGTTFHSADEGCALIDSTVTCSSEGITAAENPQAFDVNLDIDPGYVIANEATHDDPNKAKLSATAMLTPPLGRVDSNGNESIDGEDCHIGIIGGANILGSGSDPGCGFAVTPPAAFDGLVDFNGDGGITAADSCSHGCFFDHDLSDGRVVMDDLFTGLSPTIIGKRANLNGGTEPTVDGADDSNAFYGDTSIIDGYLDCNHWGEIANAGTPGDGLINENDNCTLIGYDGTLDGMTIAVAAGEFVTADGSLIPDGTALPVVFPDPTTPTNGDIGDSFFAWSAKSDANDFAMLTVHVEGRADLQVTGIGTAPASTGLSPTIVGGLADLNGDGTGDGDDDSNEFYGDTSIIDGALDCDAWNSANDNGSDGSDPVNSRTIDGDDNCTLIGYDGTLDGMTIAVAAGEFVTADGSLIPDGTALPVVFPDPTTPTNGDIGDSFFAWSAISGKVDSNGDEQIDGDDCHVGIIGSANILGSGCGFAPTPPSALNGLVDVNGDGDITTAGDTCFDGCFFGHDVSSGLVVSVMNDAPLPVDPLDPGNFNFISVEVSVQNLGPSDAADVTVTNTYPNSLPLFDIASETTNFDVLAADGQEVVNFQQNVSQGLRDGPYPSSNTVDVQSVTTDDDPGNNSDTQDADVYTVPDPPVLKAAEPGNGEIAVQWQRGDFGDGDPDGGDAIVGYDVILTPTGGAPDATFFPIETIPFNATTGQFGIVVPADNGTEYLVEVAARNGAGESKRSAEFFTATPCSDCAVAIIGENQAFSIVSGQSGGGGGAGFAIAQFGTGPCSSALSGIAASSTNPIVSCFELEADETGGDGGLIAALREQGAVGGECGTLTCIGGQVVNSIVAVDEDEVVTQYVLLDKSITTDLLGQPCDTSPHRGKACYPYQVFLNGDLIGTSFRADWCAGEDAIPEGDKGCVVEFTVLNKNVRGNKNDIGDILAVIVYNTDPRNGYG